MAIEAIDLPMANKAYRPAVSYRSKVGLARLGLVLAVFSFWEFASGTLFSTFWISKPSLIAAYIFKWVVYGDFFYQLSFTFGSMIAGFTLGTVLGLLAGDVLMRMQLVSYVLHPFLVGIDRLPRRVAGSSLV